MAESSVEQDLIQNVYIKTTELLEEKNKESLLAYLQECCGSSGSSNGWRNKIEIRLDNSLEVITPAAPKNETPLTITVIEFFTHCCINCIHSIEDVNVCFKRLNATCSFPSCQLSLLSVHSPKFPREKCKQSVELFCQKMKMTDHLVINDPNCTLWNNWGIICWPTLVVMLGPPINFNGEPLLCDENVLFVLMGEGQGESLEFLLKTTLNHFNGSDTKNNNYENNQTVLDSGLKLDSNKESVVRNKELMLNYPGKVSYFEGMLAVSDSGNNRIILTSIDGEVSHVIGSGERGNEDGTLTTAKFYNPQGVAFRDEKILYVADTGNHCIREINLDNCSVSTLVPTSWSQLLDNGSSLRLKSPWDISRLDENVFLVAAAGNHQIFAYFFAPTRLYNKTYEGNSFHLVAGTGKEENRNNMYILKSSFAQPSGLAVSAHGSNENEKNIYIADSESSSIRFINSSGRVAGLVGGSKDPSDLFAFGDQDGCSYDVKLQHPMGICTTRSSNKVFIADTFNHKIKMIDVDTKHCTTLIGDGIAADDLGAFTGYLTPKRLGLHNITGKEPATVPSIQIARFNEPAGLCIDDEGSNLYIADTNNCKIKVANLTSLMVTELELHWSSEEPNAPLKKKVTTYARTISVPLNTQLNFVFENVPDHLETSLWKLRDPQCNVELQSGTMAPDDSIEMPCVQVNEAELIVDLFFCGETACFKKTVKFLLVTCENYEESSGKLTFDCKDLL